MQNKSCRTFEKKFHQIENEVCTNCGMTKSESDQERAEHLYRCVRLAFFYDDPDYQSHGPKEKEVRLTKESYAHFLQIFQGPITTIPVDSPDEPC